MNQRHLIATIFGSILSGCVSTNPTLHPADKPLGTVQTLAFGSCNDQNRPQPLWQPIKAIKPDLWIWAGDMVYADTDQKKEWQAAYSKQLENPGYQSLVSQVPVIGVWDDHDFALNDSDRTAKNKSTSQEVTLDFLNEPDESPRRQRNGIYQDYHFTSTLGPVHIYLLDTRYHKDPWGPEQGNILGEQQWQWLDESLQQHSKGIHLFVSSIQLVPQDHPWESWNRFANERSKFLDLIKKHRLQIPIVLSGDRHIAELSHIPGEELENQHGLWEITSSGLTHSYIAFESERNRYRVGTVFAELNFGSLVFDAETKSITLRIHDHQSQVVRSASISLEKGS
ncbi:alkaline phosphatase D family protein [Pseudobacteriovorax antillogorgiicola]|uniref:Alkaline phosphatase D n=1 Tax=Pseudobacteriovorax antillogorgiicola TaxID=1513793 RepID=A0A1Y6BZC0_9BACT|nr:alkaline phosphatase D family protein [Pseudobacteriovorax antillogorgiicola]TCS52465.1 alkaline phosphatase D [Pseudobacteriovorax antillogorgiicola]SMF28414.1 alkaline phosphatase D [Pseudobacteriovorax antillogorgiicola]